MPFPQKDGGASSVYHSALGLILNHIDLKILAINTPKDWVEISTIPLQFAEATSFEYSVVDTRVKRIDAFINLFTTKSYFVSRFYSKSFELHLIEILKNNEYDIIQLEHLYMCVYFDIIREYSKTKIVLRAQNVEFNLWNRLTAKTKNIFKKLYLKIATFRLQQFEIIMSQKVDGIIAISETDADIFREIAPHTAVTSVPMGLDFNTLQSYNAEMHYDNFPVFYHLGSMDWLPNVEGLKWFVESVIPEIKSVYPDFIFRIAGKKMPVWFYEKQDKNLIVDGEIENSLEYQMDKAILIVPLLSGGGIRIKIIEGMALGKTIISTSVGAEGIPYTDQENMLIANSKEDFLIQIRKCFTSKEVCRKIGKNARKIAKENFDCSSTGKKMISFYDSISRK